MKRIFIFALVTALVVTPLDYLQVLAGVETAGTLWLVPAKFAFVGALLGILAYWLDPKPHPAKTRAVVMHGVSFAMAYLSTLSKAPEGNIFVCMAWILFWQQVLSYALFEIKFKEVLPFLLLLATAGPLAEWLGVKFGSFTYLVSPGTIPIWLPLLWANGAYFTRALTGEEAND